MKKYMNTKKTDGYQLGTGLKAACIFAVILLITFVVCMGSAEAAGSDYQPGTHVKVNAWTLNFREGAGTNYSIMSTFRKGRIVEVGGSYMDWVIVTDGSRWGYVSSRWVAEVAPEQPTQTYTDTDLYWLSRIVHAEAQGEGFAGKVAVANVVMNRVESKEFPSTIKGVVFQSYRGIPQFSPVANGSIYDRPAESATKAAREALEGRKEVAGALFFYNPDLTSRTNWIRKRAVVKRIGGHLFCE